MCVSDFSPEVLRNSLVLVDALHARIGRDAILQSLWKNRPQWQHSKLLLRRFDGVCWSIMVPIIEIISRHVLVDYVRRRGDDYWNYFSSPPSRFPSLLAAIMEPEAWLRIRNETAANESSLVDCLQLEHWPQW